MILFLFIFAQSNQQSVNNEYDRLPLMRYPLESIWDLNLMLAIQKKYNLANRSEKQLHFFHSSHQNYQLSWPKFGTFVETKVGNWKINLMKKMSIVQVILFEVTCAIFYTNLHELFCQFISWSNLVNSGKFMDNGWISCQVLADMKKVYDNLIINL